MKDYYDVLDIPVTATPAEIKAQYKRLVRIYHPDRFINPLDKVYAERKLKELNEAYTILSANAKTPDTTEPSPTLPIPIVEPAVLEFGAIAVGQPYSVKFKVGNAGGPSKNISFVYCDDHAWYSIAKVRQVYPDKSFPVEIEVVVNPKQLTPSRQYQSWFDVNMDGATARVELRLQTHKQAGGFRFTPHRLALVAATCCLIIAITLAIPWARSFGIAFGLPTANPVSSSQLTKAVEIRSGVSDEPSAQTGREWAPIFSPDRRQVAFISSQLGASQVFIRDPQSGRLQQVTYSADEKLTLTWSPDGSQLAFITRNTGHVAVQVFTTDEGLTATLTPAADAGEITRLLWSPDGQSLFFDLNLTGERQFYQTNVESQQMERISAPVGWE